MELNSLARKDEFHNRLQDTILKCSKHDMILVIGDVNAHVGSDNTSREDIVGKHGVGNMNDNGERLCDFSGPNTFIITGTIFPHKNIHNTTWRSPDGRTLNKIGHVLVNRQMRSSVKDTRTMRGADVDIDHYLVRSTMKIKVTKAIEKSNGIQWLDILKLKSEDIQRAYFVEVKNRFQILGDTEDRIEEHDKAMETYI